MSNLLLSSMRHYHTQGKCQKSAHSLYPMASMTGPSRFHRYCKQSSNSQEASGNATATTCILSKQVAAMIRLKIKSSDCRPLRAKYSYFPHLTCSQSHSWSLYLIKILTFSLPLQLSHGSLAQRVHEGRVSKHLQRIKAPDIVVVAGV